MNLLTAYLTRPATQRILRKKPGQEGFTLIELVVVIAILAVLIVVALPNFQGVTDDAGAAAGKKWLVDAFSECTIARTRGITGKTITVPKINGVTFSPVASAASITCPAAAGTLQTVTPALATDRSAAITNELAGRPGSGCTSR
jgi:type IV pilus assembly protein PilA